MNIGTEAGGARLAEMNGLVLKIDGFHLNGQVVDAEVVMKFGAQFLEQLDLFYLFTMNDVSRVASLGSVVSRRNSTIRPTSVLPPSRARRKKDCA